MKLLIIDMVLLCIVAAAGIWMVYYKRNIQRQAEDILDRLDRAIAGQKQKAAYNESLDAAITERLNRLIDITDMNQQKAEKDAGAVKALLCDISHQVRTPLANMMLYAGLLAEQKDAGQEKMAKSIQTQAEKLDFFMKELMRSSYLETEMIAVHPEKMPVEDLLNQVCQAQELQAMKKQIRFVTESCGGSAAFDMKWTVEAIGNILDNAIKYSPCGSEVSVSEENYDSFVCIRITDHGLGIKEQEQGLIFERFYRSDAVAQEKGLGIGLYLARAIVEKQGGYLKVDSRPGEGSAFGIFLPKWQT